MLTTYIVNLKRNADRRAFMEQQMAQMPWARVEFIDAVDGRAMSEQQRGEKFDTKRGSALIGREILPGEIGCTLSHQECYRRLLTSGDEYALILEDDAVFMGDTSVLEDVRPFLSSGKPIWLSLSHGFTWTCGRRFGRAKVGRTMWMMLTSSYLINRAAAERLLSDRPWWLADYDREIKRLGVQCWGLVPHIAEQNQQQFATEIDTAKIRIEHYSLLRRIVIALKPRNLLLRALRYMGHWEKEI